MSTGPKQIEGFTAFKKQCFLALADTDYVLVRDGDISKTRDVLSDAGYGWKGA